MAGTKDLMIGLNLAMDSGRLKLLIALGAGLLCALVVWITLGMGIGVPGEQNQGDRGDSTPGMTGSVGMETATKPVRRDAIEVENEAGKLEVGMREDVLQGIVVTGEGAPISGAEVQLQRREGQGFNIVEKRDYEHAEIVARTRTASDGTFSFTVPPLRQLALVTEADGYGSEMVFGCYGGQFHRVVMQQACVVEGLVTSAEDHSPMEGVEIWVFKASLVPALSEIVAGATLAEVRTDARGYYRIDGLPHTELQISVLPPQGIPPPNWLNVVLEPGRVVRKDFQVERGGLLTGTVHDGLSGQAIAGAEVRDDPWSMRQVRTDQHGRFELLGAEDAIWVRARGYAQTVARVGDDRRSARSVEIELHPGGAVQGRVVNQSGVAIAGVYVAGVAHGDGMSVQREWWTTRTSSQGQFRIEDLNPDLSHYLLIRHPGFGTAAHDFPTQVQAGGTVEVGDIVMRTGSAIRGRIADRAGEPMPGVFVELEGSSQGNLEDRPGEKESPQKSHDATSQSTTTDADGAFRFGDLAADSYAITARIDRSNEKSALISIEEPGQVIDGVEITFDMGLSISGSVRTPTGEAPRVFIAMLYPGGAFKPYYNSDGTFRFDGLKEGTYTVTVQIWSERAAWAPGVVSGIAAGTTGVEVILRPVAWIEGVVLEQSGEPAVGITVYGVSEYLGARSYGDRLQTGASGSFRLQVGEGDLVEVHAGQDSKREMIVPGVRAGTEDLVIVLR